MQRYHFPLSLYFSSGSVPTTQSRHHPLQRLCCADAAGFKIPQLSSKMLGGVRPLCSLLLDPYCRNYALSALGASLSMSECTGPSPDVFDLPAIPC